MTERTRSENVRVHRNASDLSHPNSCSTRKATSLGTMDEPRAVTTTRWRRIKRDGGRSLSRGGGDRDEAGFHQVWDKPSPRHSPVISGFDPLNSTIHLRLRLVQGSNNLPALAFENGRAGFGASVHWSRGVTTPSNIHSDESLVPGIENRHRCRCTWARSGAFRDTDTKRTLAWVARPTSTR